MVAKALNRTEDQILECIRAYMDGKTLQEAGGLHNIVPSTLQRIIHRRGLHTRNSSESHRKYAVNLSVFDELNEHSEYWAGFLFADGCIQSNKKRNEIKLAISSKDHNHMLKYQKFLQTDAPVRIVNNGSGFPGYTYSGQLSVLSTHSGELVQKLINLGLTGPRTPLGGLGLSRHFWRGYVDGDGYLGKPSGEKARIGLCGTLPAIEAFMRFVDASGVKSQVQPYQASSIWQVYYSSRVAARVARILYADSSVHLDRKYLIAEHMMRYESGEVAWAQYDE